MREGQKRLLFSFTQHNFHRFSQFSETELKLEPKVNSIELKTFKDFVNFLLPIEKNYNTFEKRRIIKLKRI